MHTNGLNTDKFCMKNPFLAKNMTPRPECLQEMVDNIPEDKKWECPECASVKIERRKVAVERARLKRVAQGRSLVRSATQYCFHSSALPSVLLSIQCVPKHNPVCPECKIIIPYFGKALLLVPSW